MTLSILAGLIQIVMVEAVVGACVIATSLWWATCQRLSDREGK
jgi:hypothetical protein